MVKLGNAERTARDGLGGSDGDGGKGGSSRQGMGMGEGFRGLLMKQECLMEARDID